MLCQCRLRIKTYPAISRRPAGDEGLRRGARSGGGSSSHGDGERCVTACVFNWKQKPRASVDVVGAFPGGVK